MRILVHVGIVGLLAGMSSGSVLAADWPFRHKAEVDSPNTLPQIAKSIDSIEDKILDDGTVVIKQPDVYGQSRMTLYRKNFESQLYNAIGQFNFVLSARVVRTDQAALQSQTSLSDALSNAGGSSPRGGGRGGKMSAASMNATTVVAPAAAAASPAPSSSSGDDLTLSPLETGSIDRTTKPFGYGSSTFQGINQNYGGFGLEPTVYLDELKNYQDHLNQIRRVNMGDDIADSPGYALYQIRMPVSIQPGECTRKGHGAILTATLRHEFGSDFLPTTFKNLVINDLVDQLGPLIYELIRSEEVNKYFKPEIDYKLKYKEHADSSFEIGQSNAEHLLRFIENTPKTPGINESGKTENDRNNFIERSASRHFRTTRVNSPEYGVAPSDFNDVFLTQNIYIIAANVRDRLTTKRPRANDVTTYLRRELEAAYRLMPSYETQVAIIAQHIHDRDFKKLKSDYLDFAGSLPGDLKYNFDDTKAIGDKDRVDPQKSLVRTLTILSFWIAVEAGQLNEQLRKDTRRVSDEGGFACGDLDAMEFHNTLPLPEADRAFRDYVKARWPIIAFALDPTTDQQNIADASSIRRDTQLALAFAFSTGQLGVRQFLQYQRRIEQDSETIALNRTVTTFAHGNETFGFRFYPRYQNPPQETSNFASIYNQLVKGGPGRNYQQNNSKLEPGLRELNAVVIMPSFLPSVRMEVTGNWFPLHDPDEMEVPTGRMLEQGRKIVSLQRALSTAIDCGQYRKNDLDRLMTRVDQIEAMLPMQTKTIRVPYENLLGGFQLFQQGVTSLVPQLTGFDGVDFLDGEEDVDILLYGKHFSVQETKVVVGGKYLSPLNLDMEKVVAAAKDLTDAAAKSASATPDPGQPPKTQDQNAADAKANQKAATAVKAATKSAAKVASTAKPPSTPTPGSAPPPSNTSSDNVNVEVISREVMRIKIPSDAKPTEIRNAPDKDGRDRYGQYVEVYVATPNGISNNLLIPYWKPEKKKKDDGAGGGQATTATFKAFGAFEATFSKPPTPTHPAAPHPRPDRQSPLPHLQHDDRVPPPPNAPPEHEIPPPSDGPSAFSPNRIMPSNEVGPSDPKGSQTPQTGPTSPPPGTKLPPLPRANLGARRNTSPKHLRNRGPAIEVPALPR